jgi:NAD(P)-dependent dehydrogenase (short-subunit alcohol dehydrogenase family)
VICTDDGMRSRSSFVALAAAGLGIVALQRVLRYRRGIDFAGKTVAITGGSRGLALVMARQLGAQGARLALMARDRAELERARDDLQSRGITASILVCDVRDRHQVEQSIAQIADAYGTIDVLINNAGVIQVGPADHMTVHDFENALATHFWGPLYAILAALPHMRRRGARRIVNISSIGGKIAVPHLLPYSASKFALAGLSDGLRAELAHEGIRVTSVFPGLMRTGSTYNATFKGQHQQEFAWFHTADALPGVSIAAERAARQIVEACRYGDAELVITLPARIAVIAQALVPGVFAEMMTLANGLLPAPANTADATARSGWESVSDAAPTAITALADRATRQNNELPAAR